MGVSTKKLTNRREQAVRTDCISSKLTFPALGSRRVEADFDAGRVTSNAGLLLVSQAANTVKLFDRVAACFEDKRAVWRTEHTVRDLVAQRVLGLVAGYEDLNDHDALRSDPVLAAAVGKCRPMGDGRRDARYQGFALASASTLGRLENAKAGVAADRRDLKVAHDEEALAKLFVELFIEAHDAEPASIILDFDATDIPLHGNQEGRFFHGYYRSYCYLPLYVFCGEHLLAATLRTSDRDGADGALETLQRLVVQLRAVWPSTRITVRADSGFCRDALLTWCEDEPGVEYIVGMARNARLAAHVDVHRDELTKAVEQTKQPARRFEDFRYRTLKSWSAERRVVGKAEALPGKWNPRFVVTSLPAEEWPAERLYKELYCARGDMENRIKEQQLGMFADRTSNRSLRGNQLRLTFSGLAYTALVLLRRLGLQSTSMARAQVWTLRNKLVKVGALVTQSVRRVRVSMSSSFPHQALYRLAQRRVSDVEVRG